MYVPQRLPAVFFPVLVSSVIVIATVPGLLLPCLDPALCFFIHISEFMNEIPLAQIARFVRGVYFTLLSGEALVRGRHSEKSLPCFAPQGLKQGKTELSMVADL